MNTLFDYALRNVADSEMVGLVIHNESMGHIDKPIGFSFRLKDQLAHEVVWRLFEKVAQSNSRFNALDPLTITVHYVKMPVGNGRKTVKTIGRPVSQLAQLKKSIVQVKAETKCLAMHWSSQFLVWRTIRIMSHFGMVIKKIHPEVNRLLQAAGVDLSKEEDFQS
jgi:hypothetical protein